MKNDQECPNCGSANPKILNEGQFQCAHCDTVYVNEQMMQRKRAADKEAARLKNEQIKSNAKVEHAKQANSMSKRVILIMVPMLLVIFGFVGFMAYNSMNESKKQKEELMKTLQQSMEDVRAATDSIGK